MTHPKSPNPKPGHKPDSNPDVGSPRVEDESSPREFWLGEHKVLIDEEDWPVVSRFSWHIRPNRLSNFYVFTNIKIGENKKCLALHRLLTGIKESICDHKNRNGLDNRKCNLRFATHSQNSANRVRKNKLGYRGVYMPKGSPTYSCQIQIPKGKRLHRHGFKTIEEAARAYDQLSKEFHGEFGIRNFKD